jgi:hypothetical protein
MTTESLGDAEDGDAGKKRKKKGQSVCNVGVSNLDLGNLFNGWPDDPALFEVREGHDRVFESRWLFLMVYIYWKVLSSLSLYCFISDSTSLNHKFGKFFLHV